MARREDWGVLRFDRLGRRLKLSLALAGAAAAGGVGSVALVARTRSEELALRTATEEQTDPVPRR